ncbi:MAG: DUF1669 domain-containing protein [Anaerolineae bacterium]|nr:MAG: DUF1669 domain-containing protein [Anaerolineae bacterium]
MAHRVWRVITLLLALALVGTACADVTFGDDELTMSEMQATAEAVFAEAAFTSVAEDASPTAAPATEPPATQPAFPTLDLSPTPLLADLPTESGPSPTATTDPILSVLPPTATLEAPLPTVEPSPTVALPPLWEVYFTEPRRLGAGDEIVNRLISLINGAQTSIHVVAFEFNLDPVADALIAAHERGVEVIWITDNEYGLVADTDEGHGQFARLRDAGITVLADNRTGLMHNKFIVIDGETVWTGSTNITHNDTQLNNNNVIVLHAPEAAAIYEREFTEMLAGQFGPRSPSNVAEQWAIVEGVPVQVFFGPEDNVMSELARLVDGAQESVRFMSFSFTHEALGFIMRVQAGLGLDVAGVFETLGSKTIYSEMQPFVCAGVPVRMDGNPRLLHHKVVIIDETIVATGSFNFSANADQSNDENLLVIASPDVARLYIEEFNRRWEEGRTPEAGVDVTCD